MADATVLGMGGKGILVSTDPLFMINVAFSVASGLAYICGVRGATLVLN